MCISQYIAQFYFSIAVQGKVTFKNHGFTWFEHILSVDVQPKYSEELKNA